MRTRGTRDKVTETQMLQNLQKASKIVAGSDFETRKTDSRALLLPIPPMLLQSGLGPQQPTKQAFQKVYSALHIAKPKGHHMLILLNFAEAINRMITFL